MSRPEPTNLLRDFRDFIARGNVIDLAVAVILGAAFGKIVSSLVDQIIMPPIGLLLGKVDFSKLKYVLQPADPAHKVAEVAIGYGVFVNAVIAFLIIAFVVFLLVKLLSVTRRQEAEAPAEPPAPSPTESLLSEIRDILKASR